MFHSNHVPLETYVPCTVTAYLQTRTEQSFNMKLLSTSHGDAAVAIPHHLSSEDAADSTITAARGLPSSPDSLNQSTGRPEPSRGPNPNGGNAIKEV